MLVHLFCKFHEALGMNGELLASDFAPQPGAQPSLRTPVMADTTANEGIRYDIAARSLVRCLPREGFHDREHRAGRIPEHPKATGTAPSEVVWPQTGAPPDAGQHTGADLLVVVKREDKIKASLRAPAFGGSPIVSSETSRSGAERSEPGAPWPRTSGARRFERDSQQLGGRLSVLQALGDDAESKGLDAREGFIASIPVAEHAGQPRHLGDPAPVLFPLDLDG